MRLRRGRRIRLHMRSAYAVDHGCFRGLSWVWLLQRGKRGTAVCRDNGSPSAAGGAILSKYEMSGQQIVIRFRGALA